MEHTQTYARQNSTMIARDETDTLQNLQVCYSEMDNGQFALGDGTITTTSAHTMQIDGDYPVKPGIELALFLELPEAERPLCIPQVRALWLDGQPCWRTPPSSEDQNGGLDGYTS